jgi:hypothetical protein
MFTEFANHPGTVTFVAADGSEQVERADRMPDWVKFVPDAAGRAIPVVKIARVRSEGGFNLRSYGPDGRLLSVTLSAVSAPTAEAESRPPVSGGWF